MKEKLGPQFPVLWASDNPIDMFAFLESNQTEPEAIEILKHVLGFLNYHPQFSEKSFKDMIEEYEKKTMEIEEKYRIFRDAYFIGRREEMDCIMKDLCSPCKGN